MVVVRHDVLIGGEKDGQRVPQSTDPNITQIAYGMSTYSLRQVEASGQLVEFWACDGLLTTTALSRLLLYYDPPPI